MCGIFGFFNPTRELSYEVDGWAEAMALSLHHRGPDGSGITRKLNNRCLLGHTRLSIIDLEHGDQPMCNHDGSVCVTFNGEIYNYLEIKADLIKKGYSFKTTSDTEVLVYLYEAYGEKLVDHLNGMFAFAIVDEKKNKIVLARDRFGEKPLYYAWIHGGTTLVFASELKTLLLLPEVDKSIDHAGLAQYLAMNYIPAPRTHLKGIKKLQPAECLVLHDRSALHAHQYWHVSFTGERRDKPEILIDEFKTILNDAVKLRLRSDVPVGAFLSGGIDSSLIVSAIKEVAPDIALKTYCATFDDDLLNEGPYAKLMADHLGFQHTEINVDSKRMLATFDMLIEHFDEPFGDPSMFPTYAVSHAARQDLKVMLSGDGADEIFGGYSHWYTYYAWNKYREIRVVQQLAHALKPHYHWRGKGVLDFLGKDDWSLAFNHTAWDFSLGLFSPEHKDEATEGMLEIRDRTRQHISSTFPLGSMQSSLTEFYLPEQILVKVDRASMKNSLESRAPFLDYRLVEFAAKIHPDRHFHKRMGKALLRKALPRWVPDEIRWRKKRGFTPPMYTWLKQELKHEMQAALCASSEINNILSVTSLKHKFGEHLKGVDHTGVLFRWLMLYKQLERIKKYA
jgi:asparagine synthase (glutamine-hydrolysing)